MEYENQRAVYADDQRDILAGFSSLMEMVAKMENVPCDEETACLQNKTRIAEAHYLDFNVQG